MPKDTSKTKKAKINPDYVRMYYDHQYDRIEKNENQAMTISNIVFTVTAAILAFGFNNQQSLGSKVILFLPLVIIVANVTAILYIRENTRWIRAHQIRAKRILETYTPELYSLDQETSAPPIRGALNRSITQYLIHSIFIIVGLMLLFILDV